MILFNLEKGFSRERHLAGPAGKISVVCEPALFVEPYTRAVRQGEFPHVSFRRHQRNPLDRLFGTGGGEIAPRKHQDSGGRGTGIPEHTPQAAPANLRMQSIQPLPDLFRRSFRIVGLPQFFHQSVDLRIPLLIRHPLYESMPDGGRNIGLGIDEIQDSALSFSLVHSSRRYSAFWVNV